MSGRGVRAEESKKGLAESVARKKTKQLKINVPKLSLLSIKYPSVAIYKYQFKNVKIVI